MSLTKNHYNLCHFIFGFSAPFFFGYFPVQYLKWVGFCNISFWNKALIQYKIFSRRFLLKTVINEEYRFFEIWSVKSAVVVTFLVSFINEVIDDPVQNSISFFKDWYHLAIDISGIMVFLLFYNALLYVKKKNV